jgi:hypothetical protein
MEKLMEKLIQKSVSYWIDELDVRHPIKKSKNKTFKNKIIKEIYITTGSCESLFFLGCKIDFIKISSLKTSYLSNITFTGTSVKKLEHSINYCLNALNINRYYHLLEFPDLIDFPVYFMNLYYDNIQTVSLHKETRELYIGNAGNISVTKLNIFYNKPLYNLIIPDENNLKKINNDSIILRNISTSSKIPTHFYNTSYRLVFYNNQNYIKFYSKKLDFFKLNQDNFILKRLSIKFTDLHQFENPLGNYSLYLKN